MEYEISSVSPAHVDLVWPEVAPLAERGLRQIRDDALTADGIRSAIVEGRYLLWVVHQGEEVIGVLVLNILQRRSGLVLFVVMVAGREFQKWAPKAQSLLRDFMDLTGAVKIESHSRPGMEAWMRELGWRKRAVIMEYTDGQ